MKHEGKTSEIIVNLLKNATKWAKMLRFLFLKIEIFEFFQIFSGHFQATF
jgi:hypothetical protein